MAEMLSSYAKQLNQSPIPAGKRKVLLAALTLFSKRGFHATTTAEIARTAGVSEGTIYRYFPSKKELLKQLLTPILMEIRSNFFDKLSFNLPFNEFISFVVRDRLIFIQDNVDLFRVLIQETMVDPEVLKSYRFILNADNGFYKKVEELQASYPEVNQSLTPQQIIRIAIGPMLAFIAQIQITSSKLSVDDDSLDFQLLCRQIIAGLTVDNNQKSNQNLKYMHN